MRQGFAVGFGQRTFAGGYGFNNVEGVEIPFQALRGARLNGEIFRVGVPVGVAANYSPSASGYISASTSS